MEFSEEGAGEGHAGQTQHTKVEMGKNLTHVGRTERFGVTMSGLWGVGEGGGERLIQGQEGRV